jgi:hypothetical protein
MGMSFRPTRQQLPDRHPEYFNPEFIRISDWIPAKNMREDG